MRIQGTKAAYAVQFTYLNALGLDNDEAHAVKKGKEVDVDNKVAKAVIKAGYATVVVKAVEVKVEKKLTLHKKEEVK